MAKYFMNVTSLDDLKNQFKVLAKKNHPDAGGDAEIMKEINAEYDELFPIWRHRYNQTAKAPTQETADSTRRQFYTQHGWAGDKYKPERSTKEVAALVRAYVKATYPDYRFSVRTMSSSMCSELYVEITRAPEPLYKTFDELSRDERDRVWVEAIKNSWVRGRDADVLDDVAAKHLCEQYGQREFLQVYRDDVAAMIEDIDHEVSSYRYDDCDGMIDYFNVNFYWFGVQVSRDLKIVPKKTAKTTHSKTTAAAPAPAAPAAPDMHGMTREDFDIAETEHTRTNERIYVVKIIPTLSREKYLEVQKWMKAIGGYYSRYVHGFVFRQDPTETLSA